MVIGWQSLRAYTLPAAFLCEWMGVSHAALKPTIRFKPGVLFSMEILPWLAEHRQGSRAAQCQRQTSLSTARDSAHFGYLSRTVVHLIGLVLELHIHSIHQS